MGVEGTTPRLLFRIALGLAVALWANPIRACSFVDEAAASAASIRISNYYLLATALLGIICVLVAFYRRRWFWSLIVVALVLIFHPSRTITPLHAPDCTYPNIELSQAAFALVAIMFVFHLWRIVVARRRSHLGT